MSDLGVGGVWASISMRDSVQWEWGAQRGADEPLLSQRGDNTGGVRIRDQGTGPPYEEGKWRLPGKASLRAPTCPDPRPRAQTKPRSPLPARPRGQALEGRHCSEREPEESQGTVPCPSPCPASREPAAQLAGWVWVGGSPAQPGPNSGTLLAVTSLTRWPCGWPSSGTSWS